MDLNSTTQIPFPPANFDIWPLTRTGALVFDGAVIIVVLLLWVIPRLIYKKTTYDEEVGSINNGIVSRYKTWGFWVSGVDAIYVENGEMMLVSRRLCCCSRKVIMFPTENIQRLDLKRRKFFSFRILLGLFYAVLIGLLVGFWAHFIPCIWWTCDLGYYDGQDVRGAIWFTLWPILFIVFTLLYPIVELEVTVRPDPGRVKPKVYTLAVGDGSARTTANMAARRDLETLRELIGQDPDNKDKSS